ncbi:hypothetical protein ACE7GA_23785 [Roseomonas sp. CCTCC AB2023176]|uniref:hypothetical protein n=1 Tax=Roseomonas sp. CCTCC AB2023176 TaxID=3342640 RepID=UPI0035D5E414
MRNATSTAAVLGAVLLLLPGTSQAQKGAAPATTPPAAAPPAARSPAAEVGALPPQIAGLRRQEPVTDYEARPNGRGLGASINYESPTGTPYVTIYLYNRNRSDLTTPGVGPAADAELATSRREIENASENRGYRIGSVTRLPDIPGPGGAAAFRCDAYTFEYAEEQTTADSFACVGVAQGRFVKVRLSHRARANTVAARPLPMDVMRSIAELTGFGAGRPAVGGKS